MLRRFDLADEEGGGGYEAVHEGGVTIALLANVLSYDSP